MSHVERKGLTFVAALVATIAIASPQALHSQALSYRLVEGWAQLPSGVEAWGQTIGVELDADGNLWVFHRCFAENCNGGRENVAPMLKYDPSGRLLDSWGEGMFNWPHGFFIDADGYIWTSDARGVGDKGHQVMKFTQGGTLLMTLGTAGVAGDGEDTFDGPADVAVAPNGDIFLADGYASNHIFKFDKSGKYLMHFGVKGNSLKQFNTAHGMTLDTRYDPPRLLICDRNHEPKGRLVHYDLDGNFLAEVVTGLGMPTSVSIQGDYVSVPDLHGRLVILDKSNTIMAVLGHNTDASKRVNFEVPQEEWIEGVFSGTHGSYWDKEGNLYVQDWNISGRLMKLIRVK